MSRSQIKAKKLYFINEIINNIRIFPLRMIGVTEGYKQQWAFHTCYAHEIDWQDEQKLNLMSKIIFYYSNNYQNSYFHVFQH